MSKIGFPNTVLTRLEEEVSAAATIIKIPDGEYSAWIGILEADDFYFAVLVNADNDQEIVKIKFNGSSPAGGIAVERGQEGTSGLVWPRGTMIYQELTADTFENVIQKDNRQVAFIPDGVLTTDYNGEKVYQTDLQIWWKAVGNGTTDWRLIAGVILTAAPAFSPPAGTYGNGTPITITSTTPGSAIYYTTDGSDPDDTDTLYTAPITLPDNDTTTLKAIAYGPERYHTVSNITSGSYTMQVLGWFEVSQFGLGGAPSDSLVFTGGTGRLYCGLAGTLREFDNVDLMPDVSGVFFHPSTGSCNQIGGLAEFNNKIYAAVGPGSIAAQLVEWDGISAWIHRCGVLDVFNNGNGGPGYLAVLGGTLYMSVSGGRAELFAWDGVNTLNLIAPTPGGPPGWSTIDLRVFGGKLYMTGSPGNLYEFNGVNAWVNVANPPIGLNAAMWGLAEYSGNLYGSGDDGALYLWNGVNAWTLAVNPPNVNFHNARAFTWNSLVWFVSQATGVLYSWNGVGSAWTQQATQLGTFRGSILQDYLTQLYDWTSFNGASPQTNLLRFQ